MCVLMLKLSCLLLQNRLVKVLHAIAAEWDEKGLLPKKVADGMLG